MRDDGPDGGYTSQRHLWYGGELKYGGDEDYAAGDEEAEEDETVFFGDILWRHIKDFNEFEDEYSFGENGDYVEELGGGGGGVGWARNVQGHMGWRVVAAVMPLWGRHASLQVVAVVVRTPGSWRSPVT